MLVTCEPHSANCLVPLCRIEEVDWDATFCNIDTFGFVRWLAYIIETGEVDKLSVFIVRRVDLSLYPVVEYEIRHPGPYLAWKHGVISTTLESCQPDIDSHLVKHSKKTRQGGISASGRFHGMFEVPALVARRFREADHMVPRTEVELATEFQAIISNENRFVMTVIDLMRSLNVIDATVMCLLRRLRPIKGGGRCSKID